MSEWVETSKASGGGSQTYSDTAPSNPSEGDVWLDSSYRKPATKVYDGDKWVTTNEGSNVPGTQTITSDTTVDVSDINEVVDVEIRGGRGGRGENGYHGDNYSSVGGYGTGIVASIDLSHFNTLSIARKSGQDGEYTSGRYITTKYYAGDGGDGMMLSGDGTSLIGAGGGGGGYARDVDGGFADGGDGGGPNGGSGASTPETLGGYAGSPYVANHSAVQKKSTSDSTSAKVDLFI